MPNSDVPTLETLAFVQPHLPSPPARILEVGCGDGALASRLQTLGYRILAIDSSEKAIMRARQRGLDARVVQWPDFEEAPFDVVMFTRSLHHIGPLEQAVARAKHLLRVPGRVLVEDFAFKEIAPLAIEWLYQVLVVLSEAGVLRSEADGFAARVLREGGSPAAWQAAHDPHLHTADTMLASLQQHFPDVEATTAPYLYRYVCAVMEEDAASFALASRILALEKRFAELANAPLIGRRFVAHHSIDF
jgi:SAM-dependent methyltransferase